ncbi:MULTISPECIES: hypothetical protein [Nostoc]|nr:MULTISPECIES: hypothetical protein [Nostoc]
MENWALAKQGIGHGAWGIGHWELGKGGVKFSPHFPSHRSPVTS